MGAQYVRLELGFIEFCQERMQVVDKEDAVGILTDELAYRFNFVDDAMVLCAEALVRHEVVEDFGIDDDAGKVGEARFEFVGPDEARAKDGLRIKMRVAKGNATAQADAMLDQFPLKQHEVVQFMKD